MKKTRTTPTPSIVAATLIAIRRNTKKSIADYDRALRIDPNLTKVCLNRGCAYVEIAEYEKAVSDLSRVQEKTEHEAILYVVYTCRGYAYKELGDFDSAVADYNRAFKIDPKYVETDLDKAKARATALFD